MVDNICVKERETTSNRQKKDARSMCCSLITMQVTRSLTAGGVDNEEDHKPRFCSFALYLELAKGGTEKGSEKERYKSKRFSEEKSTTPAGHRVATLSPSTPLLPPLLQCIEKTGMTDAHKGGQLSVMRGWMSPIHESVKQ